MINWIKAHSQPARLVTRIWWSNDESDYSDCPSNNGTFDSSCFPSGKSAANAVKVEFGSDVTSIGFNVFEESEELTHVTIPGNVISIMENAFYYCSNLTNVTIGNGVMSIGSNAFDNCSLLTNIMIPNSVTSIGNWAFQYCGSLTNVTFFGKTLSQVQGMDNYPWGISNTSIIHVA